MSWDTNQVVIVGRLTRDPDVAYTKQNTAVAKFSIAVNRGGQTEDVNFFDVVAWDKLADTCSKYLQKGKQVIITGRLQQNRFQDKNGQNRSKVEIIAGNVQFIGGQQGDQSSPQGGFQGRTAPQQRNTEQRSSGGFNGGYGGNQEPIDWDDFSENPADPF